MSSLIRTDNIAKKDGTGEVSMDALNQGRAKAWCNFDGTGSAVSWERDSFGVSSYTDGGSGNYTITFSSARANDDFSATFGGNQFHTVTNSQTTTTLDITKHGSAHTGSDASIVTVTIHGD